MSDKKKVKAPLQKKQDTSKPGPTIPIKRDSSIFGKVWKLLNMDGGRDKLCRFVQYLLLAIVAVLRSAGMLEIAASCDIVRSNMSFIRMAMRFGKP